MTNIVLKLNDNGEITLSDGALAFPSLENIKHYTIEGDVDTTNYDGVHALANGLNVAEAANRIVNEIQDIREYAAENDLLEPRARLEPGTLRHLESSKFTRV